MVVNDAILQLSGYRLPDLVQTVFAQQPISTIFADNRENVTLKTQTAPLEKGFGYGGGFLAGAAGTRVRANFQPMPYYGVLQADAQWSRSRELHDARRPDDLARDGGRTRQRRRALRHRRRDLRLVAAADRQSRCCRSSRGRATGSISGFRSRTKPGPAARSTSCCS